MGRFVSVRFGSFWLEYLGSPLEGILWLAKCCKIQQLITFIQQKYLFNFNKNNFIQQKYLFNFNKNDFIQQKYLFNFNKK